MTADEIDAAVLAYFTPDWTPDPEDGWFQVGDLAARLGKPWNTVHGMVAAAVKAGDFETRKSGRQRWYRKIENREHDPKIGGLV